MASAAPTPVRLPNRRDPKVDHVPELRKRKEREEREDGETENHATSQEQRAQGEGPPNVSTNVSTNVAAKVIIPSETVILYFDGACRRGANITCSSGVFWEDYESKYSRGRILQHANDSMEAEIYAATHAIITAQLILKEEKERQTVQRGEERGNKKPRTETGIHTFVFRGDSMVIANAIKTGDILRFDDRLKLAKQAAAWAKLRTEYEKLIALGYSIKWEWIPRMQNREADELCNAALDQREPNNQVKSATCVNPVSTEQLLRLVEQLA